MRFEIFFLLQVHALLSPRVRVRVNGLDKLPMQSRHRWMIPPMVLPYVIPKRSSMGNLMLAVSTVSTVMPIVYDNVMAWKFFSHYWPFVRGIHRSTVDSPHKGPVVWSLELTVNRKVSWRSFDITVIRCLWQGIFRTMRFICLTRTRSLRHVLVFDMVLLILCI